MRRRSGSAPATRSTTTWRATRVGATNTSSVLAFLSAWTSTLHAAGYQSGVYSSADSGVRDLAAALGHGLSSSPTTSGSPAGTTSRAPTTRRCRPVTGPTTSACTSTPAAHDATYGGDDDQHRQRLRRRRDAGAGSGAPLIPDGTFVQVDGRPGRLPDRRRRAAVGQRSRRCTPARRSRRSPRPSSIACGRSRPTGRSSPRPPGASTGSPAVPRCAVSDWSVFGGVQPYVTVDQWDLDNITDPLAHLAPVSRSTGRS